MGIEKNKKLSEAACERRRHAEERLRAKTAKMQIPRTEEEAQKLVQELEVHQIELEMQNAELRRIQEELELSRNKYTELYDFAPVGYFTFDAHGLVLEVNHAGAQLLGIGWPINPLAVLLLMPPGRKYSLITSKVFCKDRAQRDVKSESRSKAAR